MFSSIVVDFEGFPLRQGQYAVKELGYYTVDDGNYGVMTFQPPHAWQELSFQEKRNAVWIMNNMHHFSWSDGEISYNRLKTMLMLMCWDKHIIYCKGFEKSKYLETLIGKPVIDLDECPKAMDLPNYGINCTKHGLDYNHCAIAKVVKFSHYIKQKMLTS